MKAIIRILALATAGILLAPFESSRAQSNAAFTFESGAGQGVELWRIGLQRAPHTLARLSSWEVTVAWEAQLGRWTTDAAPRGIWDASITPLVRFEPPGDGGWAVFLEGAVGAHLISRNKVHGGLDMSSAYQFGDHVGIGVRLHTVEVVFRHQHLSNASTVQPNHGVNFNMLRVVVYMP